MNITESVVAAAAAAAAAAAVAAEVAVSVVSAVAQGEPCLCPGRVARVHGW
jgi:hypothetical protein